MSRFAIQLLDVSKTFAGQVPGASSVYAVNDVNPAIRPGEFFTLLGPTGWGKTTTLHLIAGFEQPTRGDV